MFGSGVMWLGEIRRQSLLGVIGLIIIIVIIVIVIHCCDQYHCCHCHRYQGRVVRKGVNVYLGLKVNLGFNFSCR